jgi:NAD(P)-dependent dehydrogenase (short-subunit alcohol dehydrogenase family)
VRLARDGFDVGVTWHTDREGAEVTAREVQEHGGRAVVTQLDVTRVADAADTVEERAARLMVESGTSGRIVNITSVHEHIPLRDAAAYCAAKGGLGLLTKVMALELAEHGIAVNARPGRRSPRP